jgi:hypothetical protein
MMSPPGATANREAGAFPENAARGIRRDLVVVVVQAVFPEVTALPHRLHDVVPTLSNVG